MRLIILLGKLAYYIFVTSAILAIFCAFFGSKLLNSDIPLLVYIGEYSRIYLNQWLLLFRIK